MSRRSYIFLLASVMLIFSMLAVLMAPRQVNAAMQFPTIIFATSTRTPTPINVGNFIWDDIDMDGVQDAGEPGIAGVQVQLWNGAKTQLIHTATTNASGFYALVAPAPGDYRVRVLLPAAGDYFTIKDAPNDQTDSDINPTGTHYGFTDIYTFPSNLISITTIDTGIVKYRTPTPTRTPTPVSLGNFVWHDLNANGIQNAGEPGVGGVTVQLWNGAKTMLITSTTTGANGNYTLVGPGPGEYRIRVIPSGGASFSPINQGADDTKDSDINAAGSDFGFTAVINVASNVISITSLDAGLVGVVPTPIPSITPTPDGTPEPIFLNSLFVPFIRRE